VIARVLKRRRRAADHRLEVAEVPGVDGQVGGDDD
jgi:hypothetical protein